jgi:hypothetical protein
VPSASESFASTPVEAGIASTPSSTTEYASGAETGGAL